MKKITKIIVIPGIVLLALLLVIQLVPFGRNHANPPIQSEPAWDNPDTRALAKRACFDCHSNETIWPWYSNIAPVSWLLAVDVSEGRQRMNFSEWEQGGKQDLDEIVEILQEGEMPPFQYLLMHPEAKLSTSEKQALIDGFSNSLP